MTIVVHSSFNVVISLVACYVMKPAEAPSAGPAALRRCPLLTDDTSTCECPTMRCPV